MSVPVRLTVPVPHTPEAASGFHDDQLGLLHPRLGFFGVIEERIELEVVATIADEHPEWAVVMAGPDLCRMPFALNEATRFISPTDTLEYRAGEKPVVSTPVRDVVSLYGAAVAAAPLPFVRACEAMLAETDAPRLERNTRMVNTVSMHSRQHTAEAIDGLLQLALRQAHQQRAATVEAQPQRVAATAG
jgi:hypothetical protein